MASTEEVRFLRLPLAQIPRLLEVVPLYECLREFRLCYQYVSPTHSETLLRFLLVKPDLQKLEFLCVPLASSAILALRDSLQGLAVPPLRTVAFRACNLGDTSVEFLAEGVAASATLQDLDLTANSVRNGGAVALAHALRASTCRLEKLTLNRNRIGSAGVLALHKATVGPRPINIEIDLGDNPVGWQASYLSETHIRVNDGTDLDRLHFRLLFPLSALEHWRQRLCFAVEQLHFSDGKWIASAALVIPLMLVLFQGLCLL